MTARRPGRRKGDESGSATAELALALPTLMLIIAVAIWMQSAVAVQARCQDAARAGARAAARGDPDGTIRSALGTSLPPGAQIGIRRDGSEVTVSVRASVSVPGGLSAVLSPPSVSGSATAVDEQAP
ncbi:MAG TPA: TadE family type IV pilus minor pilin [Frankiaceae bacterium]|nr:TadE family type IV pilus minor pilin [Frankiaceae bacterium]